MPLPEGYKLTFPAEVPASELSERIRAAAVRSSYMREEEIFTKVRVSMLAFFGKTTPQTRLSDIEVFRGTFADMQGAVDPSWQVIGCGYRQMTARVTLNELVGAVIKKDWPTGIMLPLTTGHEVATFLIDEFRRRFNTTAYTDDRRMDRKTGKRIT